MSGSFKLSNLEKLIAQDPKLLFTMASYFLVLAIYINSIFFQSAILGTAASVLYFLVNGIFLAHAFFENEDAFFRLLFGILLLVIFLGFFGWLSIIIYNLDVTRFSLVLLVVATLSSLLNKGMKHNNAT